MAELRLVMWSLPEFAVAIFTWSVWFTGHLLPPADDRELIALRSYRVITLAIGLLLIALALQHSGQVDPRTALWWMYFVASTLTPLGIRYARFTSGWAPTRLEIAYWAVSAFSVAGLITVPGVFVLGSRINPLGYPQAVSGLSATLLVLAQVLAVAQSARQRFEQGTFGPVKGAQGMAATWFVFAISASLDQLTMTFQWPLPPVFWLGTLAVTTAFARLVHAHHEVIARELQEVSLARAAVLERIARDEPLEPVLDSIQALPEFVPNENARLVSIASERSSLLRELEAQALHDPLTGLANRTLGVRRLAEALEAADGTVCLMVIDLNGFKRINDTLGHITGDAVLVEVARRFGQVVPPQATLARFGGDEFVLILPRTTRAISERLARDLSAVLEPPFDSAGTHLFVSASIGLSFAPDDSIDLVGLHARADMAMYHAKTRHGQAHFEPFMAELFRQRLTLETALRGALEDARQFSLQYQPIIDLKTGEWRSLGVLLRWNHPELGSIDPLRFIPLAEESDMILELGNWVLRESCRQMVAWQRAGLVSLPISVNVSVTQCEYPGFVAGVRAALQESGLEPRFLTLEVVENVILQRFDEVAGHFEELRDWGVRIAIDDFGTGFSSLQYIHKLPFDVLKVDRTFVQQLTAEDTGMINPMALIDTILSLARWLDKTVVIEGVETESQREILMELGCELAQGYLFARPLSVAEVVNGSRFSIDAVLEARVGQTS